MKRSIAKLAGIAGLAAIYVLSASPIKANSYWDLDLFDPPQEIAAHSTFSLGNFDITNPGDLDGYDQVGYNPVSEMLVSANVTFQFVGSDNSALSFLISFGAEDLITSVIKDFLISDVSGALIGAGFVQLSDNGQVSYSIENKGDSSFWLNSAYLEAESAGKLPSVPDGGTTLGLLGFALLGVSALRKKLAAR